MGFVVVRWLLFVACSSLCVVSCLLCVAMCCVGVCCLVIVVVRRMLFLFVCLCVVRCSLFVVCLLFVCCLFVVACWLPVGW